MDQIKSGKLIAEERKKQGLTQKQLADKLNISDKTVSKWECGNGFPELSLITPLCSELDISVNELLSGERITDEEYKEKAEENIMKFINKKSREEKIITTVLEIVLTVILIVGTVLIKASATDGEMLRMGIMTFASLLGGIAVWLAITLTMKNK